MKNDETTSIRQQSQSPRLIRDEATPNPDTHRFCLSDSIPFWSAPLEFLHYDQCTNSPLARKLFGFAWCRGVLIGRDFIAVTKVSGMPGVDWKILARPLSQLIHEHLERKELVILPPQQPQQQAGAQPQMQPTEGQMKGKGPEREHQSQSHGHRHGPGENKIPTSTQLNQQKENAQSNPSNPVEMRIIEILEQEIRPAVAQDGGDVVFHSFHEGRVYLQLKGACSGCPSSEMTLKHGIEARLQRELPEVQEVLSI